MTLERVLEPEVMDSDEEASDYDLVDNEAVNHRFCDDLLAAAPALGRVLDVGTGTARIPIELCRCADPASVVAIDLASTMLALARRNVEQAGLLGRVELARRDAKVSGFASGSFDVAMSNSIMHHIPEPAAAFAEMVRVVAAGGLVFVRDLARPPSDAEVRRLVALHAGVPEGASAAERGVYERQRMLFEASLRAGLTAAEVEDMVRALPLSSSEVRMTSDRHWTFIGRVS